MPTFCFRTDDGELVERFFRCGAAPKRVKTADGRVANRSIADEHRGMVSGQKGWPLLCEGAGVHPSQRKDAYEESVKLGVPTRFAPDGRAIFTDRSHRANYLKAKGMFDKDGGYRETYQR